MDMPAPFSGGRDSRAFMSVSVCLGLTLFFSLLLGLCGWRLVVEGGVGENVVSDACQNGLSLGIFCCLLGGGECRVFVVALGSDGAEV